MGIVDLWSQWKSPKGLLLYDDNRLTIAAELHPLTSQINKPADDKHLVLAFRTRSVWALARRGPRENRSALPPPYPESW